MSFAFRSLRTASLVCRIKSFACQMSIPRNLFRGYNIKHPFGIVLLVQICNLHLVRLWILNPRLQCRDYKSRPAKAVGSVYLVAVDFNLPANASATMRTVGSVHITQKLPHRNIDPVREFAL